MSIVKERFHFKFEQIDLCCHSLTIIFFLKWRYFFSHSVSMPKEAKLVQAFFSSYFLMNINLTDTNNYNRAFRPKYLICITFVQVTCALNVHGTQFLSRSIYLRFEIWFHSALKLELELLL